MNSPIRILGIDTSLRSTGVGVVEARGSKLTAVEYMTVKTPQRYSVSECLKRLSNTITETVERVKPEAAAVEGVFYCKNVRTAVILGEARGVAIAACACNEIPVYEYAPRKVKQAVVGYGAAGKDQVASMVLSLLGLNEMPGEDESDALAVAICHLHNRTGHAVLMPKTI